MLGSLLCVLLLGLAGGSELPDISLSTSAYLLPRTISPFHYYLNFRLHITNCLKNLPECGYDGIAWIFFKPLESDVEDIYFHTRGKLSISQVYLEEVSASSNSPLGSIDTIMAEYNNNTYMQHIRAVKPLNINETYVLKIQFSSPFSDTLEGFYKSIYFKQGSSGLVFATQLEPDHARSMFPCFDEPRYKATFQVEVEVERNIRDLGYHALSNSPIKVQKPCSNGKCVTVFKNTKRPISTYLFALVISNFKSSEPKTFTNHCGKNQESTIEVRNWAPDYFWTEESERDMNVSLNMAPTIMNKFINLFDMNYPWEKIDLISIPDLGPGAMENAGLITYREEILYPSNNTKSLYGNAMVVSHELAHQWFGNIITIEWWRDLWLVEGLATFAELVTGYPSLFKKTDIDDLGPYEQSICVKIHTSSFHVDAHPDSKALSSDAWTRDEIKAKANPLAYGKGAKLFNMYAQCLGKEIFFEGVRSFLKEFAFKNVQPKDFTKHLSLAVENAEVSKRPKTPVDVTKLFSDWYLLPGYPVLTVKRNGNKLNITQERFFTVLGDASPSISNGSSWYIPITYFTDLDVHRKSELPITYFNKGEYNVEIDFARKNPKWYIINNKVMGLYRVNYPIENWYAIRRQLSTYAGIKTINPLNRAQLLDDVFHLAISESGPYVSFEVVLELSSYLVNERDPVPWEVFMWSYKSLLPLAADDPELISCLLLFMRSMRDQYFENEKSPPQVRDTLRSFITEIEKPSSARGDAQLHRRSLGEIMTKKKFDVRKHYSPKNLLSQRQQIIKWITHVWCKNRAGPCIEARKKFQKKKPVEYRNIRIYL